MEGEYKMFIDSLSERNKSKNAIKGFNPCIELSLLKETCYLILLLLMNASTSYSNHIHFQGKLFLSKDNPAAFMANL